MDKLQFVALITTAASSFVLVLLSWMQSNVRLSRVEALLDTAVQRQATDMKDVRSQITEVDKKQSSAVSGLRSEMQALFAEADARRSAEMKEVRDRLTTIDNHLMTFYTVTGRLEGRIDELSRK